MKTRICARGLLTAAASVLLLTIGTGVAHADEDPFMPGGSSVIDQIVTSTPGLSVDPADRGGSLVGSDSVGMACENQFVRCR
jgi:hypothetical protein